MRASRYSLKPSPGQVPDNTHPHMDGLVGWWILNEGDGDKVCDASGNDNDGTWNGTGDHWTPFVRGTSGQFNGSIDYVDCGTGSILDLERTDLMTFIANVRINDNTRFEAFIAKEESAGNFRGYLFYSFAGKLALFLQSSPVGNNRILVTETTASLQNNTEHFVAATYDGSSAASGVTLYVDGLVQPDDDVINGLSATIVTTVEARLGSRDSLSLPFSGLIDDARIYKRLLTQDEIVDIMLNPYAPFQRPRKAKIFDVGVIIPIIMHHRQQQRVAA